MIGALIAVVAIAGGAPPPVQTDSGRLALAILPTSSHGENVALERRFMFALGSALEGWRRFELVDRSPGFLDRRPLRPARFMVACAVRAESSAVVVSARLFDNESGQVAYRDSVATSPDGIEAAAALIARRLAPELLRIAARPRTPPSVAGLEPTPPQAAVLAYSRAILFLDRRDTTAAILQFEQALRLYPAYHVVCRELRRLKPDALCR